MIFRIHDKVTKKEYEVEGIEKVGQEWLCHCPLPGHTDIHPSFNVNPTMRYWYCFPCGRGGGFAEKILTNEPEAIYVYVNERGEPIAKKIKQANKDYPYCWMGKDKDGNWSVGLNNKKIILPLFNLPEVIKEEKFVCVPEGEKDAINITKEFGWTATTNPMGAGPGKWKKTYNKYLKGTKVLIFEDNDKQGARFAIEKAKSIAKVAEKVLIVKLPNMGDHEDISDWIERGGTKEQLLDLIKNTVPYIIGDEDDLQIAAAFNPKVYGLILKETYGFKADADLSRFWIYEPEYKMWSIHGDTVVKKLLRNKYLKDEDQRDYRCSEIVNYLKQSNSMKEQEMKTLSPPPYLIPFDNCVVDMSMFSKKLPNSNRFVHTEEEAEIKIIPYSRELFFTNKLAVNYNPEHQTCPRIDKIFSQLVSKEDLPILYEIAAYCLWRDYPSPKIFMIYGGGHNGKSQYAAALRRILGEENISAWNSTSLNQRFSKSSLYDKFANMGSEEGTMTTMADTAILKELTGGDWITAERKHERAFEYQNYSKLVFFGNTCPSTNDLSDGWMRRPFIVKFPNKFEKNIHEIEEIRNIMDTVSDEEFEGLVYKLVHQYLPKLIRGNWIFHNELNVDQNREFYTEITNPVRAFINLYTESDTEGYIFCQEFQEKCREWLQKEKKINLTEREIASRMGTKGEGFETKPRTHSTKKNPDGKLAKPMAYLGIKWIVYNILIKNNEGGRNEKTRLSRFKRVLCR